MHCANKIVRVAGPLHLEVVNYRGMQGRKLIIVRRQSFNAQVHLSMNSEPFIEELLSPPKLFYNMTKFSFIFRVSVTYTFYDTFSKGLFIYYVRLSTSCSRTLTAYRCFFS